MAFDSPKNSQEWLEMIKKLESLSINSHSIKDPTMIKLNSIINIEHKTISIDPPND